jgi:hypothetical protein
VLEHMLWLSKRHEREPGNELSEPKSTENTSPSQG